MGDSGIGEVEEKLGEEGKSQVSEGGGRNALLTSSASEDMNKMDNLEVLLQPYLEKITDPSEEMYFTDSQKRIFKIALCDFNAAEEEEGEEEYAQHFDVDKDNDV